MASRPVSFSLESLLVSLFSPMLTRCLIVRRVDGCHRAAPLLCFLLLLATRSGSYGDSNIQVLVLCRVLSLFCAWRFMGILLQQMKNSRSDVGGIVNDPFPDHLASIYVAPRIWAPIHSCTSFPLGGLSQLVLFRILFNRLPSSLEPQSLADHCMQATPSL